MNKPGIHRVTPNTKMGRSMIRTGRDVQYGAISPEVREWNARVEQAKRDKYERRITKPVDR